MVTRATRRRRIRQDPAQYSFAGKQEIRLAVKNLAIATQDLDNAVQMSRNEGATWRQIGYLFGVTRQAAQIRFSHLSKEVPPGKGKPRLQKIPRAGRPAWLPALEYDHR